MSALPKDFAASRQRVSDTQSIDCFLEVFVNASPFFDMENVRTPVFL